MTTPTERLLAKLPDAKQAANGKRQNVLSTELTGEARIDRANRLLTEASEMELEPEEPKPADPSTGSTSTQSREKRTRRPSKPTESQATALVKLAERARAEFFHSPGSDPNGFATIPISKHRETWRIGCKAFRFWLQRLYWQTNKSAPNSQAMQDAIGVLRGKALFDGPEIPVFVRIAEHDGATYVDLANANWRAVCIDASGWEVVDNPPVRFVRPRGMRALPAPRRGGNVDELRRFVNVNSNDDWVLLHAWLVAAYRPRGPYPVLALHGEQGSAKSTLLRILRELVDPNEAPLRSSPKEVRDLMIAALNAWILAFDNFSKIPDWLSDALCRLSTGGGYSTRELYSDGEECIFDAERPVMLNGISEVVTRPDLLDRAISLVLPTIPDDHRRTESKLWSEFQEARPRILGAILESVSTAIRHVDSVIIDQKPRMADFAVWAVAAEGCKPGAFLAAYAGNRETLNASAIESCIVAEPLLQFLDGRDEWSGTATELLKSLESAAGERTVKRNEWPKRPNLLSGQLRRIAPNLRRMGINVHFDEREKTARRRKIVRITRSETVQTVQTVQSSTDDRSAARPDRPGAFSEDAENPEESVQMDGADDADDEFPDCSADDIDEDRVQVTI